MITDDLYLAISNIVNIRVTPSNLRRTMEAVSGTGGSTNAVKTAMIIELLLAFAKLETKLVKKNEK